MALALGHGVDDVDRAPARILDDRLLAVAPRELPVELELEAGEAVVVDTGEAEHLRRDRVLRVRATLFRIEVEADEVSPRERTCLRGIGLAHHVDEAAPAVRERRRERAR